MIIDKVDFQDKITNRTAHMDGYDQLMCRAVLTSMMLALLSLKDLDIVWRLFDEYVEHYYSQTPTMRILEGIRLGQK